MVAELSIITLAQAIQQSVAPVFLLAGIGGILNVLTGRLARIIDRSRSLYQRLEHVTDEREEGIREELKTLTRRGRVVIAMLFVNAVMGWHSDTPIAVLFILAMVCLIISLTGFLREIQLATRVMLNGP
jgi:hypothetical protein